MTNSKQEALDLIKRTTQNKYPLRWVDEQTCSFDYDGREVSIDVFSVERGYPAEREFLNSIRDIRQKLKELVGSSCLFIFHSAEATKTYYSHLVKDLL